MNIKAITIISAAALAIMLGFNFSRSSEPLMTEDGESSATVLPLDQKSSAVDFQTATFGMG